MLGQCDLEPGNWERTPYGRNIEDETGPMSRTHINCREKQVQSLGRRDEGQNAPRILNYWVFLWRALSADVIPGLTED